VIFLTLLIRLFHVIKLNVVFNDCKTKQCLRLVKVTTALQSRDGAVVRVLASHQCVPGSIPDCHEPQAWVIAQAFPVFDIKFAFAFAFFALLI